MRRSRQQQRVIVFERLHDEGQTVILVTHEEHVAERTRRQLRVRDGKIVADVKLERPS